MKAIKKIIIQVLLIILLLPWLFFKFYAVICSFIADELDKLADKVERMGDINGSDFL